MIVRQGMRLAVLGIAMGLIAAAGLSRLMTNLLYDLAPTDMPTFGAVAGLLAISALVACCVPAIRAASVDPNAALRSE
jgi:ABC-type antimicrobial peptide transport system permease subunit